MSRLEALEPAERASEYLGCSPEVNFRLSCAESGEGGVCPHEQAREGGGLG